MYLVQYCLEDLPPVVLKPVFLTFNSDSLNFIPADISTWIKCSSFQKKEAFKEAVGTLGLNIKDELELPHGV